MEKNTIARSPKKAGEDESKPTPKQLSKLSYLFLSTGLHKTAPQVIEEWQGQKVNLTIRVFEEWCRLCLRKDTASALINLMLKFPDEHRTMLKFIVTYTR